MNFPQLQLFVTDKTNASKNQVNYRQTLERNFTVIFIPPATRNSRLKAGS
jgi:hypothetical protein